MTLRILVIEDTPEHREDIETLLRSGGHVVSSASDGPGGLEMARVQPFDVILLDFKLPDMDGLVVAELLRGNAERSHENTTVIAISAADEPEHLRERLLAAGCSGFILKSELGTLLKRIDEIHAGAREHLPSEQRSRFMQENSFELASKLRTQHKKSGELIQHLQYSLIDSERRASMGGLVGSIAHQLNNPITGLLLNLECAVSEQPGSPAAQEYVDAAMGQARDMRSLLRTLLGSFKAQAAELERVDLAGSVSDVLALLSRNIHQQRIEVVWKDPRAPFIIPGKRALLEQLIQNLVQNSLDVMPNGGVLTLALSKVRRTVTLQISDTGPGLPPDARLFELFYTTKPDGHGIGLYVCQLIARLHNGEISATNRASGGAQFTISLQGAK